MNEGLESLQEQVRKLTKLVEDNNSMLKSIQRRAKMTILLSCIKWLFIFGVTFGSFFFLQPYIDQAFGAYKQITNPFSSGSTETATFDSNQAEGLINAVRAYMPR